MIDVSARLAHVDARLAYPTEADGVVPCRPPDPLVTAET